MCDYEEFIFTCTHSTIRLKSYCHFARNDPNHQCFGVKKLRNVWDQDFECERCMEKKRRDQWGRVAKYGGACSTMGQGGSQAGGHRS